MDVHVCSRSNTDSDAAGSGGGGEEAVIINTRDDAICHSRVIERPDLEKH